MHFDAKPQIRYPIALVLLALGAGLLQAFPQVEPFFIVLWLLVVGIYAKEVAAGLAFALLFLILFKFFAKLPLGVTIFIVVLVLLFSGGI